MKAAPELRHEDKQMNHCVAFSTLPRLEWHGNRPFAIASLHPDYARTLEALALRMEEPIKQLPVTAGWENSAQENPTGSRYGNYNAFMLDADMLPLFLALRSLYRFLLDSIALPRRPCYLQAWFNVHRSGQRLVRHKHHAHFIGYFVAHGEGSVTRFGAWPITHESDFPVENRDGMLVVTLGKNHYHEVSHWTNPERARVSFAFDIVCTDGVPDDPQSTAAGGVGRHVLIPFDGPGFDV